MLDYFVIFIIVLAFATFGIFALEHSQRVREKIISELDASVDKDGSLETFVLDNDLVAPVVPFPTTEELGIKANSNLERVYKHLTTHKYLKKSDFKFLNLRKGSGYIYRLRKMGFTISTQTNIDGKFICYKLICYKLKTDND